jgi:sulfonate transport system ATP-binding protein
MIQDLFVEIHSMRYPNQYGPGNLIENLSIKIPDGQFVSVVGPSGAGKTTLLRIMAGLERRFEGIVKLGDQVITRPTREMQIVFQDYRLLPWKTVAQNLAFALKKGDGNFDNRTILHLLDLVQLNGKEGVWPKSLSGGEEGRVAFARTLIDSPKVLLLDEPFRNVDMIVRSGLQKTLLRALDHHSMTVVLVSHSIEDAILLSDSIYLFSRSPMSTPVHFKVDLPKPRNPGNREVAELTATIVRTMFELNSPSEGT